MATRYLLYSHDGFGLGHTRRNLLIARAVLRADPGAQVTLITGVAARPGWLESTRRLRVVRVPSLLKDASGAYRGGAIPFEEAVAVRAERFSHEVAAGRPHVVVVDRHPGGTAGELWVGLERAHDQGSALVLGLRDVLDEPQMVAAELAGEGWRDVPELFDEVLVYGARHFVDHEREYGLPVRPRYCGWLVPASPPVGHGRWSLVVAAGGGGDGRPVFDLGAALLAGRPGWSGLFAAGPYADHESVAVASRALGERLTVMEAATGCQWLFAHAGAVLCMAGYNSTLEALAAGQRPILVPRRSPRREQAIRAWRLAALGLADVVDEGAEAAEVDWLLGRGRRLEPGRLEAAGIDLHGARRAAARLGELTARVAVR
jgi:predicted glycosyltransferase